MARVPLRRDDPLAPLPVESWLVAHREDWPWWVLAGLFLLMSVLFLPSALLSLPTLGVATAAGAVPVLRPWLEGCERIPSS